MKGCWYFITYYVCPLCSRSKEYRERRHTPRPDSWKDRHQEIDDACWSHFL